MFDSHKRRVDTFSFIVASTIQFYRRELGHERVSFTVATYEEFSDS